MHPEFIQFGSFIIKRSEIIFVERETDKIIINIRQNGVERSFEMTYQSEYSRDEQFAKLTIEMDAWALDYEWKHPLIKQIFIMREVMRDIEEEMKKFRKEIEIFRKQMKFKRLQHPAKPL